MPPARCNVASLRITSHPEQAQPPNQSAASGSRIVIRWVLFGAAAVTCLELPFVCDACRWQLLGFPLPSSAGVGTEGVQGSPDALGGEHVGQGAWWPLFWPPPVIMTALSLQPSGGHAHGHDSGQSSVLPLSGRAHLHARPRRVLPAVAMTRSSRRSRRPPSPSRRQPLHAAPGCRPPPAHTPARSHSSA